jgi:hypothetical protein
MLELFFENSLHVLQDETKCPKFFSALMLQNFEDIKPLIQRLLNKEDVPLLRKWNPIFSHLKCTRTFLYLKLLHLTSWPSTLQTKNLHITPQKFAIYSKFPEETWPMALLMEEILNDNSLSLQTTSFSGLCHSMKQNKD